MRAQSASSGTTAHAALSIVASTSSEEDKQLARVGQQPLAHLLALDRGDVLADPDDEVDGAVAVGDRHGAREQPAIVAALAVDRVLQARARRLAGQRAHDQEVLHRDRLAVLVEDLPAVQQRGAAAGDQRVDVRDAGELGGRAVGEAQAAVGRDRRDRLAEVLDDRLQPALGAAQVVEQPRVVEGLGGAGGEVAAELRARRR